MLKGVGHLGIVVKDIEAFLDKICPMLLLERPAITERPEKGMRVTVVQLGELQLELLQDLTGESWLTKDPRAAFGNYIHHFCLESNNLDQDVADLKQRGAAMMTPEPNVGLRGKRVIFVKPEELGGVAVEVSEP